MAARHARGTRDKPYEQPAPGRSRSPLESGTPRRNTVLRPPGSANISLTRVAHSPPDRHPPSRPHADSPRAQPAEKSTPALDKHSHIRATITPSCLTLRIARAPRRRRSDPRGRGHELDHALTAGPRCRSPIEAVTMSTSPGERRAAGVGQGSHASADAHVHRAGKPDRPARCHAHRSGAIAASPQSRSNGQTEGESDRPRRPRFRELTAWLRCLKTADSFVGPPRVRVVVDVRRGR